MTNKYAILIDGGFINQKLQKKLKRFPVADDIVKEGERIKSLPALKDMSLLRIYYYHAPPLSEVITNPIDGSTQDLGNSKRYRQNTSLLDTLELKQNFALRLGEIFTSGWKLGQNATKDLYNNTRPVEPRDFVPDINQKRPRY